MIRALARASLLALTLPCLGCASVSDPASIAPSVHPLPTTTSAPSPPRPRSGAASSIAAPPPSTSADAPTPTAREALHPPTERERAAYGWLDGAAEIRSLSVAIPAPKGFVRVTEPEGSFGAWLRDLPLRAPGTPVRTYAGDVLREADDPRIAAVAELDVGHTDLQQCADSVIRMHAEWLWSRGERDAIGYHFLSGDFATWRRWAAGERPEASGNKVAWRTTAKPSESRATFRKYLDAVFNYASTISLAQHTTQVPRADLKPGDFFVLPGGPGHAVLVLDVALSPDGRRVALLGQGYMPAQDFQVLRPRSEEGGAWFSLDGDAVDTPFWEPFPWSALHRFAKAP
jgi:hypothetical protein